MSAATRHGARESRELRFGDVFPATGVRLHYAEAGAPDGEPVLFLHGYTDSWLSFSPILPLLPRGLRALAPDQRGHGDSDRPPCGYAMADLAADAVAFLDAVGIARATVVGHSMGSFVAQRVAIDHPARVTRLVLVGSFTTTSTAEVAAMHDELAALPDPVPEDYVRGFQLACTHRPVPAAFLDRVVANSRRMPLRVWRALLEGMLGADTGSELHRIESPTLVVWGDRDAFFLREQQERLRDGIRGAELLVYDETGHAPHWEQPARFVGDLERFVARTPAA